MGLGRELRMRLGEMGLVGTWNKARLSDWDIFMIWFSGESFT